MWKTAGYLSTICGRLAFFRIMFRPCVYRPPDWLTCFYGEIVQPDVILDLISPLSYAFMHWWNQINKLTVLRPNIQICNDVGSVHGFQTVISQKQLWTPVYCKKTTKNSGSQSFQAMIPKIMAQESRDPQYRRCLEHAMRRYSNHRRLVTHNE